MIDQRHPLTVFADVGQRIGLDHLERHRRTGAQSEFIHDPRRRKLFRAANRVGKTVSLAEELALRVLGEHPHQFHRAGPDFKGLVMGVTTRQMVQSGLLGWLWHFLGGDIHTGDPGPYIDPQLSYDKTLGITGSRDPSIKIVDGPGAGGIIYLASYAAGSQRIGGISSCCTIADEPPPEGRWTEMLARSLDVNGVIALGFTPTPDSPDVTYLRKILEEDKGRRWLHLNVHLTPENTHIEGYPFPMQTQARIDEFAADMSGRERRMRLEGWWEPAVDGRMFDNYDENVHRVEFGWDSIPAGAKLVVAIDHGTATNKQRLSLLGFAEERSPRPKIWAINEHCFEGQVTAEDVAQGALEMLAEVGATYNNVDRWVGDRSARGKNTRASTISNADIHREFATLLNRKGREVKRIHTVHKGAGSVELSTGKLNGIMARRDRDGSPHFRVHPRCVEMSRGLDRWDGDKHSPLKDILDTLRYGYMHTCRMERNTGGVVAVTQRRA